MTHSHWHPGPYSLGKLASEVVTQLPELLRGGPDLIPGLVGEHKLDTASRVAVQLRMARLLGCPVCARMFPGLGRKAGLTHEAVESALAGEPAGLAPEQYGAVVWADAIITGNGATPLDVPMAALALTDPQRQHLLFMMRLELVVHATGLMFLPNAWIDRVRMP